MMPIIKKARLEKLSVISAHSHPFSNRSVSFSSIDDYGDNLLMPKIVGRVPGRPHVTMVFGRASVDARVWISKDEPHPVDLVRVVGRPIRDISPTSSSKPARESLSEIHHRQILAFGKTGQERIQAMKVGIVGLGGTGSQVFQQLVHLGVKKFVLIDDDVVEESNLSRIVGSKPSDSTRQVAKVDVMKRLGKEINPSIEAEAVKNSVNNLSAVIKLKEVDVILCCTDNLMSRFVLNQLAFQYLIPLIDLGIEIQSAGEGKIRNAGGRVMVILPDRPCLSCMGILTPDALQKEIDRREGYITGQFIPDPSVISLNGVVASLAVTEFIDLLTGFERRKDPLTYHVYEILKGVVWREPMKPTCECNLCKEVKALGDGLNLPCRLDR